MSIVLAEDKKDYEDATMLYAGAETLFQEEDTQPITVPIIAPKKVMNFDLVEEVPDLTFSYDFLQEAMQFPDFVRCVSVVGPLHAGKTTFTDLLVRAVRDTRSQREKDAEAGKGDTSKDAASKDSNPWGAFKEKKRERILDRYTDTRWDERERGMSTKATAVSYMLNDSKGKSHVLHLLDTPGHSSFWDEVSVSSRISDGVLFVVDAVMGLTEAGKKQLTALIRQGGISPQGIVLVISQLDRLVLELRIPPTDAYFKLRFIVDEVNKVLAAESGKKERILQPQIGNVLFASGKFGFCFSLPSFARSTYVSPLRSQGETYLVCGGDNGPVSAREEEETLASSLWGDVYYFSEERKFKWKTPNAEHKRSFIEFVLEPIYKICGYCLSAEIDELKPLLRHNGGICLPASVFQLNRSDVLRKAMENFLGAAEAVVDSVTAFMPGARQGGSEKIKRFYTGDKSVFENSAPLLVHGVKSVHVPSCDKFLVLARVFSGVLSVGAHVRVLGESYSETETEDCVSVEVESLFLPGGRYMVPVSSVPSGNWVLIGGIDHFVSKTCTIVDNESEMCIFAPISHMPLSVKIACEPLQPSDLPKMVEGLRRVERAYPSVVTKVEENGEHVVIASGELALDSVLHDLRNLYTDNIEIKLTDPFVVFNETCIETSQYQCSAASPNKQNAISFVAEPLTRGEMNSLFRPAGGEYVSNEEFFLSKQFKQDRNSLLIDQLGWDALAARNLWAFGPDWDRTPSNVLLNDTLPDQVPKSDLTLIREPVVQGFQWACREGPLLEENIRNCKFKLLDAVLAHNDVAKGAGQIIPATCRAVYGAFLTAAPRILEPVNIAEIDCPQECMQSVLKVLSKRRGHVVSDFPKPGTPLHTIVAHIPAIEAFGFETDLRLYTHGLGFVLTWFDHWAVVPGDPLDKTVPLQPLQPAPAQALARDFLLKTRRRKGLSEDVVVEKYIDDVVTMGLSRHAPPQEYY